jgi:hypothetical protein
MVMTWALCFSWSHLMRTDVSSPPEYARTIFSVVIAHPFVRFGFSRYLAAAILKLCDFFVTW